MKPTKQQFEKTDDKHDEADEIRLPRHLAKQASSQTKKSKMQ